MLSLLKTLSKNVKKYSKEILVWLAMLTLSILPGIVLILIGRRERSSGKKLIGYPDDWWPKEHDDDSENTKKRIKIHDDYLHQMKKVQDDINSVPDIDDIDYLKETNEEIK